MKKVEKQLKKLSKLEKKLAKRLKKLHIENKSCCSCCGDDCQCGESCKVAKIFDFLSSALLFNKWDQKCDAPKSKDKCGPGACIAGCACYAGGKCKCGHDDAPKSKGKCSRGSCACGDDCQVEASKRVMIVELNIDFV